MRIFLLTLLLALAPIAGGGVKYVPSNDSQPLIRRDLVPLDIDAIRALAADLAILADGPLPKSASKMHHRAQILTLSLRLSPAQPRARAIESSSLEGLDRPKPPAGEYKPAKQKTLKTAEWLSQLPDDSEGSHLGQLLLDILQPIAETDPVLKQRDDKTYANRWVNVVANVSGFEDQDQVLELPPAPRDPALSTNKARYLVTALLTEVPMFSKGLEDGSTPGIELVNTSLVITEAEKPPAVPSPENSGPSGALRFQPAPDFDLKPLSRGLHTFFDKNLEPLPRGYNLNINTDKQKYLPKNRENIAAPIAMMLDAALSGRPLRRNTIFFARLKADGTLHKPIAAWDLLLQLEESKIPNGTRLIVGQGLEEELTGFLVLEKASFFTRFEVIEAPTFVAARDLFYEDGQLPPDIASASAGYREVCDKALEANNLGTFLSLSSVENRLVKASGFSSNHLSAKMLATRAIRRPAYFSESMFARELDRLLDPISQFEYEIDKTPERAIKEAYKAAREAIEPIRRRLERREALILDDAVTLLRDLNSVGRGASDILDNEEEIRHRDIKTFQKKLEAFRTKLRSLYDVSGGE